MISIKYNFLFVHIPKTGGNSLQTVLHPFSEDKFGVNPEKQDGVNQFYIQNDIYKTRKHYSLWKYKRSLPAELYKKLIKFTILRNPWDRSISYYFSLHRRVTEWDRDAFIRSLIRVRPMSYYLSEIDPSFQRLSNFIFPESTRCFKNVDFIIKYENLDEDYRILCEKIAVPYSPLPVVNKSDHEHYSKYYDDELRELVGRKFRAEIKWGGYTFSD